MQIAVIHHFADFSDTIAMRTRLSVNAISRRVRTVRKGPTYLTESKTMRVVADISLVTLMPAKLKNAMETIVPSMATISIALFPVML